MDVIGAVIRSQVWRNPGFRLLWWGETVSMMGTQITILGLPTIAILLFGAGPLEVGTLAALQFAAPLLSLVAGVLVDRVARRPAMIAANIGNMIGLGSIPVAVTLGVISLAQIYVVAFMTGLCNVLYYVASNSYVPGLVGETELMEANSKLALSGAGANVVGPPLAGALINVFGAARAITIDSLSFLVSAIAIARIPQRETAPSHPLKKGRTGFREDMLHGIRVVKDSPILWRLAATGATRNFGYYTFSAVLLIFMYRYLHLRAVQVGIILGIGGIGAVVGAVGAPAVARRLGVANTLAASSLLMGLALMVTPLTLIDASGSVLALLLVLAGAQIAIFNTTEISVRQRMTPMGAYGRVNATLSQIIGGVIPLGSLLGGTVGSVLGVIPAIILGGVLIMAGSVWVKLGKAFDSLDGGEKTQWSRNE